MATITTNGSAKTCNGVPPTSKVNGINGTSGVQVAEIDPSKLIINLTDKPKTIPKPEDMVFGQVMTDHMLITNYDPKTGWSAPVIQPYQPLQLDPASSCFQYCPNVFEGMKAYLGPDGMPRLFRPELNMARMKTSVERVALPSFDENALLELIRKLVMVDKKWIPKMPGYSLYIRPTVIGTRPSLGVAASTHAMLYVIMCPTGPYFGAGANGISLLAVYESVRSWPGGTGGFKLGLNYAPCFEPQRRAAKLGYTQCLWLLGEDRKITEAGAMNFFIVVKREKDNDLDVITPPLDGTILPGVTRASVLALCNSHSETTPLPGIPGSVKLHTHERKLTMDELTQYSESGRLLESFCAGTAVIVAAVSRIGYDGQDIVIPPWGEGAFVGKALLQRIQEIQEGHVEWNCWSVACK